MSPRLDTAPDLCGPQAPDAAVRPDGIPIPSDARALAVAALARAVARRMASTPSPAAVPAAAPS